MSVKYEVLKSFAGYSPHNRIGVSDINDAFSIVEEEVQEVVPTIDYSDGGDLWAENLSGYKSDHFPINTPVTLAVYYPDNRTQSTVIEVVRHF